MAVSETIREGSTRALVPAIACISVWIKWMLFRFVQIDPTLFVSPLTSLFGTFDRQETYCCRLSGERCSFPWYALFLLPTRVSLDRLIDFQLQVSVGCHFGKSKKKKEREEANVHPGPRVSDVDHRLIGSSLGWGAPASRAPTSAHFLRIPLEVVLQKLCSRNVSYCEPSLGLGGIFGNLGRCSILNRCVIMPERC